jgi:hypothetical protein
MKMGRTEMGRSGTEGDRIRLSPEAAIVMGLAATAVPFASSREDEAERWLRVMRLYGQVGRALQSLGVGEAPLETPSVAPERRRRDKSEDPVGEVTRVANGLARVNASNVVGTVHLFFAVLRTYAGAFDRALYARGTTRDEVVARLNRVVAERAS